MMLTLLHAESSFVQEKRENKKKKKRKEKRYIYIYSYSLIPSCPPLLFLWNKAGIEMVHIKKFVYLPCTRERERETALKIAYEHGRTWVTDVSKALQGNALTNKTVYQKCWSNVFVKTQLIRRIQWR